MTDKKLSQLFDKAFADSAADPPVTALWRRIEQRISRTNPRLRRSVLFQGLAAAAAVAALGLLFFAYHGSENARVPVHLETFLSESEKASESMRDWLQANRPVQWSLNKSAVLELDRAIDETRELVARRPTDSRLQFRLVEYTTWRTELLGGLIHGKA